MRSIASSSATLSSGTSVLASAPGPTRQASGGRFIVGRSGRGAEVVQVGAASFDTDASSPRSSVRRACPTGINLSMCGVAAPSRKALETRTRDVSLAMVRMTLPPTRKQRACHLRVGLEGPENCGEMRIGVRAGGFRAFDCIGN
jgi:hypothetical protein